MRLLCPTTDLSGQRCGTIGCAQTRQAAAAPAQVKKQTLRAFRSDVPPLMTGQVLATPLPFTCRYVRPCRGSELLSLLLPDLELKAEPQKTVRRSHLQLVVREGLRSLQGTAGRLSQHGSLCERSWAQKFAASQPWPQISPRPSGRTSPGWLQAGQPSAPPRAGELHGTPPAC